ncbi:MAG: two-component regulator propeller domain-containing protein [Sediminicola sp.]
MKYGLFALLFCMFLSHDLQGQEYYFRHFKVEDGLSHNTVFSSLQDQKGFMWFGTKNGLNRFDGYAFKLFQNDPDEPYSLQGNYVESLHEYMGTIWVGTDNGLFRYREKFENFESVAGSPNIPILDIENDGKGNLWYIAGNTLYKYTIATKETFRFPPEQFFYATVITKIGNTIWAASTNQLFRYVEETHSFRNHALDIAHNPLSPLGINRLFPLDGNRLLLGTQNHGVVSFDLQSGKTTNLMHDAERLYVRGFAKKNNEELWVATESGLYIYNLKNKRYINLKKSFNDPYALSDNAVYSLTVDNEGGIWAGTYFGGINYFPNPNTPFTKYFPKSDKNSIGGNAIREIHADMFGNLWIGSEDAGLNKFDPKTGKFTNFTSLENGGILSHYNVHGILPKGDELWISTFDHGLDILDIGTEKIIKRYNVGDGSNLKSNFIFALYETRGKEVLLVSTSGIQTYNPLMDRFELLEPFPPNYHYTCLIEDSDGTLWAGSYWSGLYYYNPKNGEKGFFKYDPKSDKSVAHNHINGIFEDSGEHIWITTENGLDRYDKKSKEFKRYGTKDGFPSNVFYSIIEDNTGTLWISTANGLVAFDPKSGSKKIYTRSNGLLSDQFNYNSAYKDPSGRMYFGSVNGLISFDPKDFAKSSFAPPIYFTGLQIDNEEVQVGQKGSPLKESIMQLDHLKLNASQSSFGIDFAALSFASPQITEYSYKLDGISKEWVNLNKNNRVYFTELAPGNYNFRVRALNSNGIWSPEKSLKIGIDPPFYASNVAYAIYLVLTSLFIFLGLRYYHDQTEVKNAQKLKRANDQKEKEIYQAKIEFFTNVSHEIRTPLTLIKNPLEKIIGRTGNDPELSHNLSIMEKNTSRLLDLVNQLLDFRKTEMENMSLSFVETNLSKLLRRTYERFSEAIKDKGLNFQLNNTEEVHAFVDTEAIKKILSNLFNNAIKYGRENIVVSLGTVGDSVEITIKNDGPLIPVHLKDKIFEPFYRVSHTGGQSGTGIGLSLAHTLTEMHHGSLKLDTSDALMNTFMLKLPLHQEREFKLYSPKSIIETRENDHTDIPKREGPRINILLVEDNEDLLDFVAKDLQERYTVLKATSAECALEILQRENIQLVVSDVSMSGMDGFTLCKKIKTNLESSHIPVVLLTAKSAMTAKMEGLESGADAYIGKPFSMEYLQVQIANLLENRQHILEHYTSSPLAHIRSIANTKTDETFIKKLDETIYNNIADPNLNVETLAEIMNMSRSTLYRKISDISNLSPNELINISRLKKAAELLKTGEYKIYEVADIVGYNSSTSFGRNFQKQFEMTPSEYIATK